MIILAHLLAAYMILAGPGLGCYFYRKAQKSISAGDPLARIRLYHVIFVEQVLSTAIITTLWLSGFVLATRLGLGAPRSWWLSAGISAALGGLMVWRAFRLRPKAQKVRERMNGRGEALLPGTSLEVRWFSVISVGAGISEELAYRGFLFYYLAFWFPHINNLELALISSLIFGLGHLYQGRKGILSTGIVGLILAGLYLLSGNLLLPIVFHAVGDLQAAIILSGPATPYDAAP